MTFQEFKKMINKNRKGNPNWFTFLGNIDGKDVRLKCCKTYLQVYEVDGIRYGGLMDISVTKFNEELERPFKELYDVRL